MPNDGDSLIIRLRKFIRPRTAKLLAIEGFRRYLSNTTWLLVEKVFRLILTLVVWAYVARYLGPEQIGLLSYATSLVGLVAVVASIGLDNVLIRELVKTPEDNDSLVGTAFWLQLLGATVVFTLVLTALRFSGFDRLTSSLVSVIAAGTLFQPSSVVNCYFQARVQSQYVVYAQIIQLLVSSVIRLVLVYSKAPLLYFAIAILGDSVFLALSFFWLYWRRNGSVMRWRFDRKLASTLVRDSWPFALSGLIMTVYMRVDQVIIKEMMSAEAVGIYATAVRLAEAWYFIPMVVTASFFPAIVNARVVSEEIYHERLLKLYDLLILVALAIALPVTFLAKSIIMWVYGKEFASGGTVLAIYIWAGIFVSLGSVNGRWLLAENLGSMAFYRNVLGAVSNILLNLALIPRFGIIGSAIATLVASAIQAHFAFAFRKKTKVVYRLQTQALLLMGILRRLRYICRFFRGAG